MSWIDIVWPMIAAACLTLALIHLGIWLKDRSQYAWLASTFLASSVASISVLEWLLMRAQTVERYAAVVHWLHVPIFVGVMSIVLSSEVPVEIGLNPIETSEGLFVLASVIDITERKRLELEAAHQRDEFTHLSRVAMLGELSASLAHELNQPLAAILSNAQAAQRFLARKDVPLDEVREIVSDIVEDDKRAGEVMRRLRVLLKKEEPHYRSVDINEVVDDVLRLMRSDLLNRRVKAGTQYASALPSIRGDRVQLQQVLLNLVINGCDAMDGTPGRPVAPCSR